MTFTALGEYKARVVPAPFHKRPWCCPTMTCPLTQGHQKSLNHLFYINYLSYVTWALRRCRAGLWVWTVCRPGAALWSVGRACKNSRHGLLEKRRSGSRAGCAAATCVPVDTLAWPMICEQPARTRHRTLSFPRTERLGNSSRFGAAGSGNIWPIRARHDSFTSLRPACTNATGVMIR